MVQDGSASRYMRVKVASGDALDVREFSVHEGISALFRVEVVARSPNPSIDFDAVVGHESSFAIDTTGGGPCSGPRRWDGICSQLQQIDVEEAGLSTYRLHIVPHLWLATQRRNYRIFQQMSDLDIALEILRGEWGMTPEVRIEAGRYKKRSYRVQYAESDYAFICRMLEDAGIAFFFEHDEGETRLVLSDSPHASAPRTALTHHGNWSGSAPIREDVATAVRIGQEVRPRRYVLRDHDFRRPSSYALMGEAAAPAGGIEDKLERYHYVPGAFLFEAGEDNATPVADDRGRARADEGEGQRIARRRLDAQRGSARACTFETNAHQLAPGTVVTITDHPHAALRGDPLLIVGGELQGRLDAEWTHVCTVHTTDVPHRPPLSTPKPTAHGIESATVVGPSGEPIHVDEFGRVRVEFHWDRRGKMNESSSCWIHVSQPWAGSGFGAIALPRVGQEVLVGFLGGDPDRPVIVGRVYTALEAPPYKLPANKTQTGIRTASTPGAGYNEILMDDAGGRELVNIQAQKDLTMLVKNNEEAVVGNNFDELIKNNHSETVGQNQQVSVGVNRTATVGKVDEVNVGIRYVVTVVPAGGAAGSASITMTDKKIVLDTGAGASITLSGPEITLHAEKIHLLGDKEIVGKVSQGDLQLLGGPHVKVNC